MVSDRAFIFHIYISWGKTLPVVPKSRSSVKVKVKYQGHSFRKNGRCGGIIVSETQLVTKSCTLVLSLPVHITTRVYFTYEAERIPNWIEMFNILLVC